MKKSSKQRRKGRECQGDARMVRSRHRGLRCTTSGLTNYITLGNTYFASEWWG